MQLHNEFFVKVPLERAWETLLDIQTVAGFLPGATIEPPDEDGAYRGMMKLKVGPVVTSYRGTARLASVDPDARRVTIDVRANEASGAGTAAAVITNVLTAENGGTKVSADTDLQVTGRQAQFGRGLMETVAGKTLDEFARRFEAYLLTPASESGSAADPQQAVGAAAGGPSHPRPPVSDEAFDLGAVVGRAAVVRYAAPAVLALVVVLILLARRRRS